MLQEEEEKVLRVTRENDFVEWTLSLLVSAAELDAVVVLSCPSSSLLLQLPSFLKQTGRVPFGAPINFVERLASTSSRRSVQVWANDPSVLSRCVAREEMSATERWGRWGLAMTFVGGQYAAWALFIQLAAHGKAP